MTSEPGGPGVARLTPDEAFAALGNETRVHILRTLWKADDPLAYSDLKERIGMRNSGQFNYHLDKLTDHFVEKAGEGYELRMAGEQVVAAVLSGTFTADPSFEPVELDGSCPHCGGAIEADYADEILSVWCTSGKGHIPTDSRPGALAESRFPPAGLVDRTPDEVARAAMTWGNSRFTPMYDGVCPRCAGPVSLTLQICDDHEGGRGQVCANCDAVFAVWALRVCDVCGFDLMVPAWHHLLGHPAVSGFFYERGVTTTPWTWEMLTAEAVRPVGEDIAEDPFRLRFTFELDGDELDVTLDEKMEVVMAEGGE